MSGKECERSVLFADVSGSARLYEKLGNTEALHAVDRCLKRMERAIEGFRGRIVKTVGDETMSVFESADDAFQAAIEMQQRIVDLPPVSGVKLTIRIGFRHGPVIEVGDEIVGGSVNDAAQLAGMAKAGQVLLDGHTQAILSKPFLLLTSALADISIESNAGKSRVFEVLWQGPKQSGVKAERDARLASGSEGSLRLCVRYAEKVIVLDSKTPGIGMGRDADSELRVRDRRASRHHARIELQGDHFVIRDQSTNGTYVTVSGESEIFLKHDELVLRGSGIFCFAASAKGPDADYAEFECL